MYALSKDEILSISKHKQSLDLYLHKNYNLFSIQMHYSFSLPITEG